MARGLAQLRLTLLPLALAGTALSAVPAAAQSEDNDARLRKVEAEVRALQRTVFPGGDGRFFTPEVITPEGTNAITTGTPATTAVTDILSRLDAMETQLTQLTAQVELNTRRTDNQHLRLSALEEFATRLTAGPASASGPATPSAGSAPLAVAPAPAPAAASAPVATPSPAPAPSAARLSAVQAIAKPQTDDPADDEYSYGYRLWNAGFFPEAQQQLQLFVENNASHWRVSYGRNLLGRAFLDDGKPREAASWFLKNYQADKQGTRAADSLLYLAQSMIAIDDTSRACIALAEFGETYPALAGGRLQADYEASRAKVTCN